MPAPFHRLPIPRRLSGVLAAMLIQAAIPAATQDSVPASYHTRTLWQTLDGIVEAVKKSTVSAQTSGTVTRIHFEVDEFVDQGAVILEIENTEQKARLAQARARLAEAEARLADARASYLRMRDLYRDRTVSRSDLDKATAAFESAKARLDAARAAVQEAERQLSYTRVEAPYSGVVVERHVEMGESVQPGQPLMTGLSLDLLRVNLDVPQRVADAVRQAGRARVHLPDGATLEIADLVFYPETNPASHTFRVRVELGEKTPRGLYPGMFVKVDVPVGERRSLVIPASALVVRSELRAVYVLGEDDEARLRQVRVGHRQDGELEILAGLREGERVVTDPAALIAAGGAAQDGTE